MIFFRILFDNLLEHLNRFGTLIRRDKTGGEFFSCVGVVRLQFKCAKIERDGFLYLLRRCVIIRDGFEDGRIIARVLRRLFEDLIDARQVVRLRFGIGFENDRGVKFPQACPEGWVVAMNFCGAVQ